MGSLITDDENPLVVSLKPVLGLAKAMEDGEDSTPPLDESHPSVSIFLQKMEATHVTSLLQRSSKSSDPSLIDFQRLSDLSPRASSCTVCLKGTTKLFVLKVRQINSSSPDTSLLDGNHGIRRLSVDQPPTEDEFRSRMMRILQGRMPFLARVLYSYQKDCNYYFIQEYINEDSTLHKLRQAGTFNPNGQKSLVRTSSHVDHQARVHAVPSHTVTRSLRSASFQAEVPSLGSSCPGTKMMEARRSRSKRLDSLPLCLSVENLQQVMQFSRDPLPEPMARFYIAEIIILFHRLHLLGFVYANLTPTTVHLDADGHIRLTRFFFLLEGVTLHDDVTITTTAPEVMAGGIFRKAADWWSVGAVLHEFLTSSMPKDGTNYTNTNCSEAARSLIDGLLEVEPEKRLGSGDIQEIKSHPFFDGFSWSHAESRKIAPPFVFGGDSTSRGITPEEEEDIFRAPTIVAQFRKLISIN